MMHQNTRLLALSLIILALLGLQGCGFHLRGAAELPPSISPLYIDGLGPHDQLRRDLRQLLRDAQVQVTDDRSQARALLRLRDQGIERRVLSVNSGGKVLEYELHHGMDFDLVDSQGNLLVDKQTIGTQRAYINPETEVLGKADEESLMGKDMSLDLAARITYRLQKQLQATSHQ